MISTEHNRGPRTAMRRGFSVLLFGSLLLPGLAPADDPVESAPLTPGLSERLDSALEETLNEPRSTRRPIVAAGSEAKSMVGSAAAAAAAVEEIPAAMRTAGSRLAEGQIEAAIESQQAALNQLDELLQALQSRRERQPGTAPTSADPTPAGESATNPDEEGQQTGEPGSSPARESLSNSGSAHPVTVNIQRRRDLAHAVWGHLPDRVREQMQQSYRERYLPEYEDLVERYYEALAEPARATDGESK
ncbi:MAG: hypothetical protein R3B90_17845 [Planctomycetaceae bacterium]